MCPTVTGHLVSTDRNRATLAPASQGRDRAEGQCPGQSHRQGPALLSDTKIPTPVLGRKGTFGERRGTDSGSHHNYTLRNCV